MKELDLENLLIGISRILVLTPHPDDEVPFTAGVIQRILNSTNIPLKLICLSKGEDTTLNFIDSDEIHNSRMHELANSCEILGIKDYQIENFPDARFTEVEDEIKLFVKEEVNEGDLVMVYEENGITGHCDHVCLSRVVREKLKNKKLFYTVGDVFELDSGSLNMVQRTVKDKPKSPTHILHLKVNELQNKIRAFEAHKSQVGVLNDEFLLYWDNNEILHKEYFYLG